MQYSRLHALSFPTTISTLSLPHTGHDFPVKGLGGEGGHDLSSEGSRSEIELCDMLSTWDIYLDAWGSSPRRMHQLFLSCGAAGMNAYG